MARAIAPGSPEVRIALATAYIEGRPQGRRPRRNVRSSASSARKSTKPTRTHPVSIRVASLLLLCVSCSFSAAAAIPARHRVPRRPGLRHVSPCASQAAACNFMAHAMESVPNAVYCKSHPVMTFTANGYSYGSARQGDQSIYTVTDGKQTLSMPIGWAFGLGTAGTDLCPRKGRGVLRELRQLLQGSGCAGHHHGRPEFSPPHPARSRGSAYGRAREARPASTATPPVPLPVASFPSPPSSPACLRALPRRNGQSHRRRPHWRTTPSSQ